MSAKIGSLNADLTMETARFHKGLKDAQSGLGKFQSSIARISRNIGLVGIAAGGAFAGLDRIFSQTAQKAKEIENSARLAGGGLEQFQRSSFAAKSVGVEMDKFADIMKDVQDKVGDFRATGGGALADFFENIAPKVGITADAFKNLSGQDALQLYYNGLKQANVSSDEMTFYMEAIASDATLLQPLLENNGKAFDELGKKAVVYTPEQIARAEAYRDAQQRVEAATERVSLALGDGGLIDSVAEVKLGFAGLIEGFAGVEAASDATDQELRTTEGPRAFGRNIREMTDGLDRFAVGVKKWGEDSREAYAGFQNSIKDWSASVQARFDAVGNSIRTWRSDVIASISETVKAIGRWLGEKLSAVFDGVRQKIAQVEGAFRWLWDRVVGNSWVPDMVDAIGDHMGRLDGLMVDKAAQATRSTEQKFRDMASNTRALLARLFPEVERLLAYRADMAEIDGSKLSDDEKTEARRRAGRSYRGENIETGKSIPVSSWLLNMKPLTDGFKDLGDGLKGLGDRAQVQTVRVAKSFKDMADATLASISRLMSAIKSGGFLGILEGVIGVGLQLGSVGAFGKTIANRINAPRGYASGTSSAARGWAWVGERGPELVNFRGGERVLNNRESAMAGRFQVEVVANNNGFGAIVRDHAGAVVAQAAPSIARAGARMAGSNQIFAASRRLS